MLRNYLKTAVKVLLRRKFYTAISLFGICVTLVVLIVASALLDHMFAPQAPESRVDRLLGVYMISMRGEQFTSTTEPGYGFLDRWVRPLAELPQVERVALASSPATGVSYLSGRKIESKLRRTDGEYWRILDFKFLEGAPFTTADDAEARFVAVINRSTRERFFGGQAHGMTAGVGDLHRRDPLLVGVRERRILLCDPRIGASARRRDRVPCNAEYAVGSHGRAKIGG